MLDKGMHASVSLSKLELESCKSTTAEQSTVMVTVLQLCVVCGLKTIHE